MSSFGKTRPAKWSAAFSISQVATNAKLPEHQRYAVSYREILKARQRKQGLAPAQSRGMRTTREAASRQGRFHPKIREIVLSPRSCLRYCVGVFHVSAS
jgi:hypothetical protein